MEDVRQTSWVVPGRSRELAESPSSLGGTNRTGSLVRTMIVDRNPLVRAGLRAELKCIDGMAVVCEATGGPLALQVSRKLEIDLAVVGTLGDGVDMVDFVLDLKQQQRSARVLCGCEPAQELRAAELVRCGVDGIVHREAPVEDFVQAVRSILRGHSCLPKSLTSRLARIEAKPASEDGGALTAREVEVLRFIAEGFSNKDIARRMHLSVRTVECHRLNLRRKSGMMRPKDLVTYAQKLGLRESTPPSSPHEGVVFQQPCAARA